MTNVHKWMSTSILENTDVWPHMATSDWNYLAYCRSCYKHWPSHKHQRRVQLFPASEILVVTSINSVVFVTTTRQKKPCDHFYIWPIRYVILSSFGVQNTALLVITKALKLFINTYNPLYAIATGSGPQNVFKPLQLFVSLWWPRKQL